MRLYKTSELFDLSHTMAAPFLEKTEYPFEILDDISDIIVTLGKNLDEKEYHQRGDNIWISKTAKV